jgi:hypothetical protein
MLAEAERLGYGCRPALGATFNNWRGYGLVGKAVGKAARRGGEGLWHPIQLQLWLALIRLRRDGALPLASLANVPVGLWLMALPGVETAQAQRALLFWMRGPTGPERPKGQRSVRLRVIRSVVEDLAVPAATSRARLELRQHLSRLTEGTAMAWDAPPTTFIDAVGRVMSPDEPRGDIVKARAASLYLGIRFQLFAALRMDVLRFDRPDVRSFWEWARRYAQGRLRAGEEAVPMFAHSDSRWTRDDVGAIRQASRFACSSTLGILGIGLHVAAGGEWTKALDAPPRIPGMSLPRAWSDRGSIRLPAFSSTASSDHEPRI